MAKAKKYVEEEIGESIKFDSKVTDGIAHLTTTEGSYATIAAEKTGIPEADIANLQSFNTTYAKAAVVKLGDTLADVYKKDKKVTGFEANIDFTNGSLTGKGDKVTTGVTKMSGPDKPWTSTGFAIKHESPKIRGLSAVKEKLYASINS